MNGGVPQSDRLSNRSPSITKPRAWHSLPPQAHDDAQCVLTALIPDRPQSVTRPRQATSGLPPAGAGSSRRKNRRRRAGKERCRRRRVGPRLSGWEGADCRNREEGRCRRSAAPTGAGQAENASPERGSPSVVLGRSRADADRPLLYIAIRADADRSSPLHGSGERPQAEPSAARIRRAPTDPARCIRRAGRVTNGMTAGGAGGLPAVRQRSGKSGQRRTRRVRPGGSRHVATAAGP